MIAAYHGHQNPITQPDTICQIELQIRNGGNKSIDVRSLACASAASDLQSANYVAGAVIVTPEASAGAPTRPRLDSIDLVRGLAIVLMALDQRSEWRCPMMRLDAGKVLKRSVLCGHCKSDYLFTLRDIAESSELRCHGCGSRICMRDSAYKTLVSDVKNNLRDIDDCQSAALFAKT